MDIYFVTSKGKELSVEICFSDMVDDIKKKVHKYHGFPVFSQTLVFNGRVLRDYCNTECYGIRQNSRIQLFLLDDDLPPIPLKVTVNIPAFNSERQLTVEASAADNVAKLKRRIHQLERNFPPDQFALFRGSIELFESNRLVYCDITHCSTVKLVPRSVPAAWLLSLRKMRVMVRSISMKILVEVSPAASVAELRVELSDLDEKFNLQLPDDYFFLHNKIVMKEDESFKWHDVKQGDTIGIIQGRLRITK